MTRLRAVLQVLVGSVWVFHGLYSKLSNGIPRHRLIVGRILGERIADHATLAVGLLEVMLGMWAWSGRYRKACAAIQTLAIVSMNALEITFARDLLISAPGMLLLNTVFLAVIWYWACSGTEKEINSN
jgi:hypothetical protein